MCGGWGARLYAAYLQALVLLEERVGGRTGRGRTRFDVVALQLQVVQLVLQARGTTPIVLALLAHRRSLVLLLLRDGG